MNAAAPGWYPDPEHPAMVRWYDGYAWTQHRTPRTPPRKPRNTGAIVAIVISSVVGGVLLLGMIAAVAIPVVLNQQDKAALRSFNSMTCDDVAAEAVLYTQDSVAPDEIPLQSTHSMILITDGRPTLHIPSGLGEAFVMKCSGRGMWADGSTTPLVIDLYTNADGAHLFSLDWDI